MSIAPANNLSALKSRTVSKDIPLVSIVIPVYNCKSYLAEAINSVLSQTYPRVELIVINDGSTDGSDEIINGYPESAFISLSQENIGQSATLNKGWSIANGEIHSYLSADDVLLNDTVERVVSHLNKRPDAIMVYGNYYYIDNLSQTKKLVCVPEINYVRMVSDFICTPGPGAFWRKSAFQKTGGWSLDFRQIPDYDFWLKLGLHGALDHIDGFVAKYRIHAESQTCSVSDAIKSEEPVLCITNYFRRKDLCGEITGYKKKSLSSAHIYSAYLHIGSGRIGPALCHILHAITLYPANILRVISLKRVASGIKMYVANLKNK
jgi:glycosyltransferase involved in cell wall biosynthesis